MLYILILLGALARLAPHPMNVTPIMALGLFSGCYINRKAALIVPLGALLVSDTLIGFYHLPIMASVYVSFALGGGIGMWLKGRKSVTTVTAGTLGGALLFYVVTNFAVWAFGGFYSPTLAGLVTCYTSAIPFFRNSLLGDLGFVALLFGSYELYGKKVDQRIAMHWQAAVARRSM